MEQQIQLRSDSFASSKRPMLDAFICTLYYGSKCHEGHSVQDTKCSVQAEGVSTIFSIFFQVLHVRLHVRTIFFFHRPQRQSPDPRSLDSGSNRIIQSHVLFYFLYVEKVFAKPPHYINQVHPRLRRERVLHGLR